MKPGNIINDKNGYTISAGILPQILRYLSYKGADINQFLPDVGIDPGILNKPDERINVEKYIMVEEKAAQVINDPCFGLHIGQYTEAGNWSILGYMMLNCSNVMEAFQKFARYSDIVGNLIKAEFIIESDKIMIRLTEPKDAPKISKYCYEGYLSSLIHLARTLTGKFICPLEVNLISLKNEYIEEYRKVFGEKVIFGRDNNEMVMDRKSAEQPSMLPNQKLLEHFENYAKEFLSEIGTIDSFTYRTKKLILSLMDSEALTIKKVAEELNISDRTLQSNLQREGTEFSRLLQETRKQLAMKYLRDNYSIEDITYLLGFSEASVFRKAFKKWVGVTPGEFRTIS